jgi:hypothetical protein
MAPSSAKAKRLPNFKLLHEREQARVERFKVRARALAALPRTNVLCYARLHAPPALRSLRPQIQPARANPVQPQIAAQSISTPRLDVPDDLRWGA